MWLRNSARDGRKGDKLSKQWLGPYKVSEVLGKGLYRLIPKQDMFSRKHTTDAGTCTLDINIRSVIILAIVKLM